jgi:Flp pilus assembly protein TadB
MNTILLFFGALIPTLIYIRIWNANQINLGTRVSSFISTKSASHELKQSKRKSIIRKRINDSEDLAKFVDSAEFGDLLAVALTAGQNPRASIDTISEFLPSDFKDGISKAIRENAFGKPLMIALNEMSDDRESKVLKPLIKQMEIAIARGTPLAEVSRKFAEDQRIKFKNLLMKQAAAKEISMLFPVVFVVLPSVLAVAMYPALTVLQKIG